MGNIFANYRSGDIDPSGMKPSYKVSEIVGKDFKITSIKKLEGKASMYSDAPTMLVNALSAEEAFVFFAAQKVLFDKLSYIQNIANQGMTGVYETVFRIIQKPTRDGKASYYDLIDVTEE